MFIYDLCKALQVYGVEYALVGGYAVALHGAPRGTLDIDLAVTWQRENLFKLETALHHLGLRSLHPIDAAQVFSDRDRLLHDKNMIAWHFTHPDQPLQAVDIIINYDLTDKAVKMIDNAQGTLVVLARQELIAMKRRSQRPQDLADINALLSMEERDN